MIAAWNCLLGCVLAGAAPASFDKTVCVGTDSAAVLVFEPPALQHRKTSPSGWIHSDVACRNEFLAGTLIAVDTGGDGGFCLRLTDGALTAREKQFVVTSHKFRFRVSTGRLFVDGDRHVPDDEFDPKQNPYDEAGYVAVPLGDYEVTAYHFRDPADDDSPPEKHLPYLTLVFRQVKDIAEVRVTWPVPLRIEGARPGEAYDTPPSYLRFDDDLRRPLDDLYLAHVRSPAFITPGDESLGWQPIDRPLHDALAKRQAAGRQSNAIVLIDEPKVGTVGMLVGAHVTVWKGDGGGFRARLAGIRPVRVVDLRQRGDLIEVEVAPLTRPRSKVPREEMDGIKADFNAFAKANAEFRRSTRHPDYLNETVAAVDSPSVLANILLQAVALPAERRQALLPLSDLERIRGLRAALKAAR